MAHTKTEKKRLAEMPAELRAVEMKEKRLERLNARRRNEGRLVGTMEAYDECVNQWYRMLDRLNKPR